MIKNLDKLTYRHFIRIQIHVTLQEENSFRRCPVVSIQSRFDTSRFDTNRSRFDTHVKSFRYTSKVDSIQAEDDSIQTEVNSIQPPFT